MKKNGYGKIIKDGIITQNPVLVQVLGMCPTLAVSTALLNGLGMGAAVTMVLVFSNLFISLLRKVIDKRIRIASFIVIIAGFVTMVEMLMKAFLPSLSESLGVYIPLIVVNCIILARAEAFASRNRPLPSVVDGLACGIGFTGAICIVSAIRELLGTGALLGYDFKLIPPIMIFTLAPGGLLVLGFVMAFCAWIGKRRRAKSAPAGEAGAETPVILSEAKDPTPEADTPLPPSGREVASEAKPRMTEGEKKSSSIGNAASSKGNFSPSVIAASGADSSLPEGAETDAPRAEGDSSSARSRLLGMTEAQPAPEAAEGGAPSDEGAVSDGLPSGTERGNALPEAQPPVLGLGPQLEKRESARPVVEIVETAEAAEEIAPQKNAPAPKASPVQGEVSPKATEGLSVSEKPQSASGADNPSVIAASGADSSPYTGEPRTSDARPYADRLQSEAEAPVILSEANDPAPEAETPQKEGDSSEVAPPRNDSVSATETPSVPEAAEGGAPS
ncbi:MAG: electron transport complex subunit RsxE, partial [Clostridia bacterium]|nr:electron transport complex subunit RsxE [Clostridia bacterium]